MCADIKSYQIIGDVFCINSLTISYPYNPEIVKTEKRITLLGVAETCRFTADIRTAARTTSAGTAAIL